MIGFDGIIYSLQSAGGITTYFDHIIRHAISKSVPHRLYLPEKVSLERFNTRSYVHEKSRVLTRYRDLSVDSDIGVFFSSYYRLSKQQIPNVVTVHDFIYEKYRSGIPKMVHSYQKKRAILNADHLICVSESTKNDLLKFNTSVDESRISVIYNGVSNAFYPEACSKGDYVLYVGQRSYYKNFALLLDALRNTGIKLKIVGGGVLSADELQKIKLFNIEYDHEININDDRLRHLYNRAVALVYPSSYEGFGIPVIEAFRCNCPVVTVPCQAVDEISGGFTIRASLNPDSIQKAIKQLISRNNTDLISNAYKHSLRFSWDDTSFKTLQVLSNYF